MRGPITATDGTVTTPSNEETVVCWGRNNWKQLGANVAQNDTARNFTPKTVADTNRQLTGITAIASGEAVTCVVNDRTDTANIACWGGGGLGVLGDGIGQEVALPKAITSTARGFTTVALGVWHGCGVTPTQYTCWGTNQVGQLGNNTATGTGAIYAPQGPYPISRYLGQAAGTITSVGVGWHHSCVTTTDGSMACWGLNDNKQLGQNGSSTNLSVPTAVVMNINTSAAPLYSPMRPRIIDGGGNEDGMRAFLNNEVYTFGSSPTRLSGWPTDLTLISTGSGFTCAVSPSQGILCAGAQNQFGQLARNNYGTTNSETPTAVYDPGGVLTNKTIISMDSGYGHTCAVADDGAVGCWGLNENGQLGNMSTGNSPSVVALNTTALGNTDTTTKKPTGIATGASFTCASTPSSVVCWGLNDSGQLGHSITPYNSLARPVGGTAFAGGARSVSANRTSVCAIAISDGRTYCWGYGATGILGNGTNPSRNETPVLASTATTLYDGIAVGSWTVCGWTAQIVECWGSNNYGGLGRGTVADSTIYGAAAVSDPNGLLTGGVRELVAAPASTCAVTRSGGIVCWGYNGSAGTNMSSSSAVPAFLAGITSPGGGLPTCRDGAALLADKRSCSLSPSLSYTYRITYTVSGADLWKSTPGIAARP